MRDMGYVYREDYSEVASNSHFMLHSHDEYEIFFFIEGDSHYVVEGNIYSLTPGDVIVIRKHQMHRVFHNSPKSYKRIVLMVSPAFFQNMQCGEYEQAFFSSKKNL
ncbi:MAG: AraC family ligand binding domain-containing protein, partial [Clostridia bacterium]|nr:AraC family ligand binding domain-containing protein [Clostridia bacterium]